MSIILELFIITVQNSFEIYNPVNVLNIPKTIFKGTFGNPNWISIYLVATFPYLLYLLKKTNKMMAKIILYLQYFVIFYIIILLKSRGAWIAFLGSMLFYFFQQIRVILKKKRVLFYFVPLILLVVFLLLYRIYFMNELSVIGRIFIWKVSLSMLLDNPIVGIGYGNYYFNFLDYQKLLSIT